eukprot:3177828-Rhodomonas_salina.2
MRVHRRSTTHWYKASPIIIVKLVQNLRPTRNLKRFGTGEQKAVQHYPGTAEAPKVILDHGGEVPRQAQDGCLGGRCCCCYVRDTLMHSRLHRGGTARRQPASASEQGKFPDRDFILDALGTQSPWRACGMDE